MDDDEKLTTEVGKLRRGFPRESHVTEQYVVQCSQGHEDTISVGDLGELLYLQACMFEDCGHDIVGIDPDLIELECTACGEAHHADWDRATQLYAFGCDQCPGPSRMCGDVQPVGTPGYERSVRDDWHGLSAGEFDREGRVDYWEGLIHFCKRESFDSILREGVIQAKPTGFYDEPAVCLSETPLPHADEIRGRFGRFGFAFLKSEILSIGGNPCLEMSDSVLQQATNDGNGDLPTSIKPFVNIVRPKQELGRTFYYLHEREWRVPDDIIFSETPPRVVLPSNENKALRQEVLADDEVLEQVHRFGRLRSFRIKRRGQ